MALLIARRLGSALLELAPEASVMDCAARLFHLFEGVGNPFVVRGVNRRCREAPQGAEGGEGLLRDHVAMAARLRAPGRHAKMEWPRGMSLPARMQRAGRRRSLSARTRLVAVLAGEDEVGRREEAEGRPLDVLARKEAEGRPSEVLAG